MAKRSKFLAVLLALMCPAACGKKAEVPKMGVLTFNNLSADELNAKWIELTAKEDAVDFTLN